MPASPPIEIHVIADSTGDTAARVARAAIAQYPGQETRIIRHPRMTRLAALEVVFERLPEVEGNSVVVFSTLVDERMREHVAEQCDRRGVPHADLLGPALRALEEVSGQAPMRQVRPVGASPDYLKRIHAMKYAFENDDGQLGTNLAEADIVLVGVSRSGKTPLSMYLGYLGYRTANIPLVRGIEPHPSLYTVDRWKVVGLSLDPERLAQVRARRVKAMGDAPSNDGYADLVHIYEELDAVNPIIRRLGCPVIDITDLALEEAAGRVIDIVEERRRAVHGAQDHDRELLKENR